MKNSYIKLTKFCVKWKLNSVKLRKYVKQTQQAF